jgi:DNA end-binding protein Ku
MPASVWRGRLVLGLVSIPVRLHKAARRERVRFHHVYRQAPAAVEEVEEDEPEPLPNPNVREFPRAEPPAESVVRVRNLPVAETAEARVEAPSVLKGYEIEKDRYVTFEPSEIQALKPKTSTELDIAEFVKLEEIDPIFFETSYYAVPDRGGEKAYLLLFRALKESGYAAVGSLTMHGREHTAVVRSGRQGLILHTLFNANEVRADEEYRAEGEVSAKELDLAKRFVGMLAAPFDATKLKDTFQEKLMELIQARAGTAVGAYEEGQTPQVTAPVVDIMEALKKSLEMARKPLKSEQGAGRKRARK